MKRSLSHLPQRKREELRLVAERITGQYSAVEMIILFGSYARADWVEDVYTEGYITYEYKSDYDLLVIVKNPLIAGRFRFWHDVAKKAAALPVTTRVTIIAHDIKYVNKQLTTGQYFFTDIKKEGVLLYDSKNFKLARRKKLDPKQRKGIAQQDFDEWYTSANEFYDDFEANLQKQRCKKAAFYLNQATENYYKTVLLVFTHYKPKGHYLDTLNSSAASCSPQFLAIFPQATGFQRRCFDLLNRAYVEARYNRGYKITKEELEYLAKRVKLLQRLTKTICREKIESFA